MPMNDGNPFMNSYGTICYPPRPWPQEAREAADHRLNQLIEERDNV